MFIGGRLRGRCLGNPTGPPVEVPLTSVSVKGSIVDFLSQVSIRQCYENNEDVPIEAIYTLPIAENATVCNFYALVSGKRIDGKVKEKEKARDDYDDAIASGNSAYLFEEEKKNQFKVSVGNLPPKEQVIIVIEYVAELYFTGSQQLDFGIPSNHELLCNATPGLQIEVDFDMTSEIRSITSPSYPVETKIDGRKAHVSLANKDTASSSPSTHFRLLISLAEPTKLVFRMQENVGMLASYLSLPDEDAVSEMIFLVDRSGSMEGAPIKKAQDTLNFFLRSLPMGTWFNIVGFGSTYESLFASGSKQYSEETFATAVAHISNLKADMLGTELMAPLKHILEAKLIAGIPRQIFLLTDGEVDNPKQCIDYVRQHAGNSRIFTFGITGASPELVGGIAQAGSGKSEMIRESEDIEKVVMAQLNRALKPAVTNLSVDWGINGVQRTPFSLPPLFSGSRTIVYCYLPDNTIPEKVTFAGDTPKGKYLLEAEVTPELLKTDTLIIPKLAARSLIRDLEDERSVYHKEGISVEDAKRMIIELSTKHNILSKFTAFVAVSENEKEIKQSMQTRDINQQMIRLEEKKKGRTKKRVVAQYNLDEDDYDLLKEEDGERSENSSTTKFSRLKQRGNTDLKSNIESRLFGSEDNDEEGGRMQDTSSVPPEGKKSKRKRRKAVEIERSYKCAAETCKKVYGSENALIMHTKLKHPDVAPSPTLVSSSAVRDIVMEQKAGGNFAASVLKFGEVTIDKLRSQIPPAISSLSPSLIDEILITAYICGLLRSKYGSEREKWEMIEKKAMSWINSQCKLINGEEANSLNWDSIAYSLVYL